MSSTAHNAIRRALLPAALAAAGAWLLVGCVYIPMFGRVSHGTDVSTKVGDERSRRPLRPGRATREDVVRILGEPWFISSSRREFAYGWGVTDGYLFNALCPPESQTFRASRSLVLRFDERGVLQTYRLFKGPPPVTTVGLKLMPFILPDDLRRDWIEQEKRRAAEQEARRSGGAAASQPASRPASQPAPGSGERLQPDAH